MVRRRRSKVKASISGKSHQGDLPAESVAAEKNVSKSLIVDASENNTLSQSEYEAIDEAEKENNATVVGCSKVDDSTIYAAEDEHIHEECAAEEVKMELEEAKGVEEGLNDCDEDVDFVLNDDYDDDDDFHEGEEGLDDYDDDNGDSEFDFDDDDNEDEDEDEDEGDGEDDDEEEEEEHDYLMEEEGTDEITKLENNGNTVKESDESQGNRVAQEEKEENAREGNEEREVGSLKKKEEISRKGKEKKKITKELSDKVAPKHNDKQEKDGQGDTMEEADQGNSKEDLQNKEGSSKQKVKKLRKSSRKVTAGGLEKLASKQDDMVGSSCRKKVKGMGMIFMCSSKTKKDCYNYKVLGLPANKRDIVGKIYKGMRLFLYDVDLKLLYGIYKAAGHGGYNIQPKAFNSQFPSQVRFTVLEDCLPLPEEKFKKVIKDNYFTKTKFDCQLTSQQVQNLCKLFVSISKGSKAIKSARRVKTYASTDQDRSRARHEERRPMMAEKRRYHEHSRHHEREVVAAPVAAVPVRLIPPAAAPPSYAYDRTRELDAYRRDLYVEHHDSHRYPVAEPRLVHRIVYSRDPLLHQPDTYRRDVAAEHRDLRFRDEIGRHDSYISYREPPPEHRDLRSRDDFGRHDPYFSYRGGTEDHNPPPQDEFRRRDGFLSFGEVPAYRDRVYTADPLPEPEHYHLTNRSEYQSAVTPLPKYGSTRSMYRY